MARTIAQILSGLKTSLIDAAASVGLTIVPNNWSKTDYKQLILNTVATSQGVEEQLYDAAINDIEAVADTLPPQTGLWFQNQMLNVFEYDAIAVPIIQLDLVTFVYYYPNPNPNFRIVKYCSVVKGLFGTTTIKIASGVSPTQISATPLSAAQSFVDTIGSPGITYNVTSLAADRLFMQLDVYYKGLYSAIIQSTVIAAINLYMSTKSQNNPNGGIEFDGVLDLLALQIAIKNVPGVTSVVLVNIRARANTTTFPAGFNLVLNNTEINKDYSTIAGYIIPETATGFTLTDTRVSNPSINNLNLIAV